MKTYIGLVGELGCGKGTVAKYFQEAHGYRIITFSDFVRDECKLHGFPNPDRNTMSDWGNYLRETYGPDILARAALILAEESCEEGVIFDGLRNPAEIEYLLQNGVCIGVIDIDREKRIKQILDRGREGDPKTREEFDLVDLRDKGKGENSNGQQVARCMEMAQYHIDNNGTKEDLWRNCEGLLREITVNKEGVRTHPER